MEVEIVYTKKQAEFFLGKMKKFNIVTKGRRSGYTRGCAQWLIQRCYEKTTMCLWVEVTYGNILRYYNRYFLPLLKKFPKDTWEFNVQRSELRIMDSIIDFRSSDVPTTLEGYGYEIIIVQEAGIVLKDPYIYEHAILPMMMDFEDSILIAGGAPKGKKHKGEDHEFYKLFQKTSLEPDDYLHFSMSPYDNPFISKSMIDLMAATMDSRTKAQELDGKFIDMVQGSPFFYAFSEEINVVDSYIPNENVPLILSFDFNIDPMTAIIGQSMAVNHITIFDEWSLKSSSTPELCAAIKAKYPGWIGRINVTGDASGSARSAMVSGGLNHYKIIKKELRVKDFQFKVRTKNISHVNSRMLCNSVLQNAQFRITKNCKTTITDAIYAAVDSEGGLLKTADQGNHALDCLRYIIDATFPDFIDKPHKYSVTKK